MRSLPTCNGCNSTASMKALNVAVIDPVKVVEESSYMYELELSRLIEIYANEERLGRVNIPLSKLLHPPFDQVSHVEQSSAPRLGASQGGLNQGETTPHIRLSTLQEQRLRFLCCGA
mgnify:CR=1 FL=1